MRIEGTGKVSSKGFRTHMTDGGGGKSVGRGGWRRGDLDRTVFRD